MLSFGLSSLHHWQNSDQFRPCNEQRDHWLISHIHSILGQEKLAVEYSVLCSELKKYHGLTDFDRAYSKEALTRAYAILGDKEKALSDINEAIEAEKISKNGEYRNYSLLI